MVGTAQPPYVGDFVYLELEDELRIMGEAAAAKNNGSLAPNCHCFAISGDSLQADYLTLVVQYYLLDTMARKDLNLM